MPVNIFGCGKMGKAMAFYLAHLGQDEINLADVDYNTAVSLRNYLSSHFPNLKTSLNVNHFVSQNILCLPWKTTFSLLKDIFNKSPGANITSITCPDDQDISELEALRKKHNFLLPCGLEPGLTELLPNYLLYKNQGLNQ